MYCNIETIAQWCEDTVFPRISALDTYFFFGGQGGRLSKGVCVWGGGGGGGGRLI